MSIKKAIEIRGIDFSIHKLTNAYFYNDNSGKRLDLFFTPYYDEIAKEAGKSFEPVHVPLSITTTEYDKETGDQKEVINEELVSFIDKILEMCYTYGVTFTKYEGGEKV
jgi:hypothetical protein